MSSNVHGLVNVKKYDVFWRLLAVCVEKTCCYRRLTTRMQLFPRIFTKLPFDYRAKNGIDSYIHRCFTPLAIWTSINMFIIHILCFGEGKKKMPCCFTHRLYACLFLSEDSAHLIIFVRASLPNIWCSPVRKTSSEYLKTRHFSCIFLTFSDKRIQSFPVAFNSANWSIRSIIQQFSSTVNSMKTIVFLVLRRRCQMGTGLYSLLTGVFQ